MEDRYNVECCEFMHAHDEIVERVQKEMPGEDTLYDLTELFRIFGDSTRIRILYVLFEAEMCVCDIAALLGMTIRYFPSAQGTEKRPAGKVTAGWQNGVLFSGGRSCENHHRSGIRAYSGVIFDFQFSSHKYKIRRKLL